MMQFLQESESDLQATLAVVEKTRAQIGSADDPLTCERIEEASQWLESYVKHTPLLFSEGLTAQNHVNVYLKPENQQITGAYKIRGAFWKIQHLTEEEKKHPLMTASAGNHAQGVARAARDLGLQAIIVMPVTTPLMKINRTKSYGAEVRLFGDSFDESFAFAVAEAKAKDYTFVHPFDDPILAQGQGSVAVEVLQDMPDIDLFLVRRPRWA